MGKTMGYPAIYKSIPYLCCYEESGMIETEQGVYSRGYQIVQPEKAARHSSEKMIRRVLRNFVIRRYISITNVKILEPMEQNGEPM